MKFEQRLTQKSVFLRNLSQPFALCIALLSGLGAMLLQYITWLIWSKNGYSLLGLSLGENDQFNIHLLVVLLLSVLSGLLVYQVLMNSIRTRNLINKTNQLKALFQSLSGTNRLLITDENALCIEDVESDISQQRAAEEEVRLQTQNLAHVARLNTLGEMASGIAHEINQPLAAISLFAQAAKRLLDCGQYERVPEAFDKLSQHAQRAGAIIERIQSMSSKHDSTKKTIECEALIAEAAKLAQAEARVYGIEIDISIARKIPAVMVDIVQIQQVILNLLRNAMQAMSAIACRNGNKIALKASMNNRHELEVSVVDSGEGISQQAETSLFEPFSTNKETGMGLGLAISRPIVEAHEGVINFYNNATFGATFYFTLPITKRDK